MRQTICIALAAAAFVAAPAHAAVSVFQGNLAAFNTAAGNPAIGIDFDSLSGDIAGSTIAGVTFSSPDGNTLDVVNAADTFSPPGYGGPGNVLPATSGAKVLSPGGANLIQGPDLRQRDSLQLVFAAPIKSFGADVLFQSLDCCSFTSYFVYGANDTLLAAAGLNINGDGNGGSLFVGFVSDATDITRIVFSEFDDNDANPDSNIGFDTFRFDAIQTGVPEPDQWALLIAGFAAAGVALRRRRPTFAHISDPLAHLA